MASGRRPPVDPWDRPAWVGWVKFLGIALLTVTCYFMGQAMVQHHFFDGGELNNQIEHLRY